MYDFEFNRKSTKTLIDMFKIENKLTRTVHSSKHTTNLLTVQVKQHLNFR